MDPGYGMGKKIRIRIRDEKPGSYFRERIRDPGWKKSGSGIRNGKTLNPRSGINIPDPQHWL
jgi:hypothetical protein